MREVTIFFLEVWPAISGLRNAEEPVSSQFMSWNDCTIPWHCVYQYGYCSEVRQAVRRSALFETWVSRKIANEFCWARQRPTRVTSPCDTAFRTIPRCQIRHVLCLLPYLSTLFTHTHDKQRGLVWQQDVCASLMHANSNNGFVTTWKQRLNVAGLRSYWQNFLVPLKIF